jgi:mRNA interferase MazF
MSYKKWDVVLVDWPFTDGSASKKRPAVIAAIILNDSGRDDVIMCAISSQPGMTGIQVPQSHSEFLQTKLRAPSRILPGKIFTISKSKIVHKIGTLGPILSNEVQQNLRTILL